MSQNLDMVEVVCMLVVEKGISVDMLLQVLVDVLVFVYKWCFGVVDEVEVQVEFETMDICFIVYDIDEEGNWVNLRDEMLSKNELGCIVAVIFCQVMSQCLCEVERDRKFEEYVNREGDIVIGIIQQFDSCYMLLDLGCVEVLFLQVEQVFYECFEFGSCLKVYIVEVCKIVKGLQIVVLCIYFGLIKCLFELEVFEIVDGIVEIKVCVRELGYCIKIVVWFNDHNVDLVGVCVGVCGVRVCMVVIELWGEKIDIVFFFDDYVDFVVKVLSFVKVKEVWIYEDIGVVEVIVLDYQFFLVIGKEGQNV